MDSELSLETKVLDLLKRLRSDRERIVLEANTIIGAINVQIRDLEDVLGIKPQPPIQPPAQPPAVEQK